MKPITKNTFIEIAQLVQEMYYAEDDIPILEVIDLAVQEAETGLEIDILIDDPDERAGDFGRRSVLFFLGKLIHKHDLALYNYVLESRTGD